VRNLFALSFIVLLLQACAGNPVVMPQPVEALSSASETKAAILAGIKRKGWRVKKEEGEKILTSVTVRNHKAVVWIDYSSGEIVYSYGGSSNLKCKADSSGEGCKSIHKKYNQWVATLNRYIVSELDRRR
jgi:hypothetical protein